MILLNEPLLAETSKTIQITFNDNVLKNTIFMLLPVVPPQWVVPNHVRLVWIKDHQVTQVEFSQVLF